jgi:hypothetical protein
MMQSKSLETEVVQMPCEKYTVSIDGEIVAENMPLNYAMLLVKSLFTEYYNDYKIQLKSVCLRC